MAVLRIQRRLLSAFLALLACVLIPAALMLDRGLGDDVQQVIRASLTREANALAAELERNPPESLPEWAQRADGPNRARVSVIGVDGRLLADTQVKAAD